MTPQRIVHVARWGAPYGYEESSFIPQTADDLVAAIQALTHEPGAELIIREHEEENWPLLTISASDGRFSVGYQASETVAFDLIGDPKATGAVPFVLGGQLVSHPRRSIVTLDPTVATALEFLRTGTVDVTQPVWERYGPTSAWHTSS